MRILEDISTQAEVRLLLSKNAVPVRWWHLSRKAAAPRCTQGWRLNGELMGPAEVPAGCEVRSFWPKLGKEAIAVHRGKGRLERTPVTMGS